MTFPFSVPEYCFYLTNSTSTEPDEIPYYALFAKVPVFTGTQIKKVYQEELTTSEKVDMTRKPDSTMSQTSP